MSASGPSGPLVCCLLIFFIVLYLHVVIANLMVFLKEFFEKVDFEKIQQTSEMHEKLPRIQRVKRIF